ncbi:SAM-dependent methyltransferase [Blastopirellula marina]|uniref:SAM-dependent methyltransferase n=1 Tax=Blastopirellula marina TaxID=124 RepID=A0A2S8FGT4_9BACT|nr:MULTISPECIES: class I SAM-dependent methyltransferase [Pirellulaceae]PQO31365.1 SAM-dependent methyltransferase [Blastopirellula marina]RCS51759.1 class I SAM-dependent methyltransferase [Bremerella cremea]
MDILNHNREAWNRQVDEKDRWTIPVTSEEINRARGGEWSLVLTPTKPVPRSWFPDDLTGVKILCLASGGGQQGPILAAAGADVTVFDNSPKQLEQDRFVVERDGLTLKTEQGDMADLSRLADGSFDLIFHPCSNCFAENILPVWREAFRVLRTGGTLLAGICNPVRFIFDEAAESERGELVVRHKIPYSDLTHLTSEELEKVVQTQPLAFGHTLEDQLGGQLKAGFLLADLFEDRFDESDLISRYVDTFMATRAIKPNH